MRIESPTGRILHLPRRELYDVRVQLLSEGPQNDAVIDQLNELDVSTGVYEGGFKTWECAIDLASLLLDRGPRKDIDELIRCDQVIEVYHYVVMQYVHRKLTLVLSSEPALLYQPWSCFNTHYTMRSHSHSCLRTTMLTCFD